MIDIVIDGIQTTAAEGQTILDAAQTIGIDIPTLCFHRALKPHRSCRACTVELVRDDRIGFVSACAYRIRGPLVIRTRSEGAISKRREIIESLLRAAPGAIAAARIARGEGIEYDAVPGAESCIRCGLCVRVCEEVIGQRALTYEGDRVGTPYRSVNDDCIGCAACAALCPTGAIVVVDRDGIRRFREGNREFELVVCQRCGRPITTQQHLAAVRKRRKIPDAVACICGGCKRAPFAEAVAAGAPLAAP